MLKALIVDDDSSSCRLITLCIKHLCERIDTVNSGYKAIEFCKNNRDIDLIMMDIQMPEIDGYEATQQIRLFNKDVIIIAQTANALASATKLAHESGCNDLIPKPFKRDQILAVISKYFNFETQSQQ